MTCSRCRVMRGPEDSPRQIILCAKHGAVDEMAKAHLVQCDACTVYFDCDCESGEDCPLLCRTCKEFQEETPA